MTDKPHVADEGPARLSPFEFSDEDNRLFRQLSMTMRIVGVALLTWGILMIPRIFQDGDLAALVLSLGLLVTGVWTVRAGHRFGAIEQTEGADMEHLMSALTSLHHLYTLVAGVIGVIVVWIVGALVFTLIVALG